MLTLQMIQLMENLWKKEGLDLRYLPPAELLIQGWGPACPWRGGSDSKII